MIRFINRTRTWPQTIDCGSQVKEVGVTTTEFARTEASSTPLPVISNPADSNLTEQQKNAKRRKTSWKQQETLEMEFNKNRTLTTIIQERIAKDINMTWRSVYMWFQNRRAKRKFVLKKSIENGENYDDIPEVRWQYLSIQAVESGKGIGINPLRQYSISTTTTPPLSQCSSPSFWSQTRTTTYSTLDTVAYLSLIQPNSYSDTPDNDTRLNEMYSEDSLNIPCSGCSNCHW
ncbi:hypothetical protein F5884DRAFT_758899 [Xylogone sp. PMI_703]|nr:hypothetical protein F5884DRAFT_758899 [Xylogone sp. PMI_703]